VGAALRGRYQITPTGSLGYGRVPAPGIAALPHRDMSSIGIKRIGLRRRPKSSITAAPKRTDDHALHSYAVEMYSHSTVTTTDEAPASNQMAFVPRSARGVDASGAPRRIRVGIIGATGYVGGELVRLLAR